MEGALHSLRPRAARGVGDEAGEHLGIRGGDEIDPLFDELVAGGHGERFDANKGTPMKEWFSLDPGSALPWPPLAREALDFARSGENARSPG